MTFEITKGMAANAGNAHPWLMRKEFAEGVKVEDIETIGSVLAKGAEEAAETGSVAEYANRLEEEAGSSGGDPLYADAAFHLERTYDDLGQNGDALRRAARVITQIAEEAQAALDFADEALNKEEGAETKRIEYSRKANDEIGQIQDALSDYREAERKVGDSIDEGVPPTNAKDVIPAEVTKMLEGMSGVGTVDAPGSSMPPKYTEDTFLGLIKQVKDKWTQRAGSVAQKTSKEIQDELDDYYGMLMKKGIDLEDMGYSEESSPMYVMYPPGRTEYEQERAPNAEGGAPAQGITEPDKKLEELLEGN